MAAVSCTSTEYIDMEELDTALVINAQMNTEEDVHTIHLNTSTRSSINKAPGASVKVSINGGPLIDAAELEEQPGNSTQYVFYETIKAGYSVEIKAQKEGLTANASFTVPPMPEISDKELECDVPHSSGPVFESAQGTASYKPDENAPYSLETWHLLKVKVKDIPSQKSYYRITLGIERVSVNEGETTISRHPIMADFSSEPALSASISSSADLVSALENSNPYNTFTDDMFPDNEYTLKIYISESSFYYYRYRSPEQAPEDYKIFLTATLHSISQGEYIYIKALGQNNLGFLFSEPVSIPSNVDSGLGYADASSSVMVKIPLETFTLDSD